MRCSSASSRVSRFLAPKRPAVIRAFHFIRPFQDHSREILETLQSHGVDLKGVSPALIDFPALRDGQEVVLCWRQGEDGVTHWHPVHTGFRGREDIEPDSHATWDYWS